MRINSERSKRIMGFTYILCLFSVIFDIIILNIDGSWESMVKTSPFAMIILLFLIYRGLPVFYYDSDGEVLNFTAKEPNLSWAGPWFQQHFEFPKRKLLSYHISTLPFRRVLTINIDSKEKHVKKQTISISYLKSREIKDLKKSLNGIIARNKMTNDRGES